MADKRINDLPVGGQVQNDDLFVIQRNGTAYSVKGEDVGGGGGGATWGSITGTLSDQTDLNTALTNKASQTDLTATQNSLQALWLLNEGQTYDIHDVTQSAYENIVGAGCKWDTTKMIGGKSLVMSQVCAVRNNTSTIGGITYVSSTDGTVTATGTATANAVGLLNGTAPNLIVGHKYYLSGCPSGGSLSTYALRYNVNGFGDTGSGVIITAVASGSDIGEILVGSNFPYVIISSGVTANFTFKPMLIDLTAMFGAGNEPTTVAQVRAILPNAYYPYNAGEIKSAVVDRVDVRGFNLLNLAGRTYVNENPFGNANLNENSYYTGVQRTGVYVPTYKPTNISINEGSVTLTTATGWVGIGFPIKVQPNTTYYRMSTLTGNAANVALTWLDSEKQYISDDTSGATSVTVTSPANASWVIVIFVGGYSNTAYTFSDINLNLSDASLNGTYKPYIAPTQTNIPASIQALDGYGQSNSDGTIYNYVDYENKEYHYFGKYVNGSWVSSTEVVTDISSLIPNNFLKDFSVEEGGAITLHNTNGDSYRIPVPNTQGYGDGIDRFEPLETDVNNINEYLGFVGSKKIVGVCADFENRTFTRLAGAYGKTAGASFNSINAFGGRRRCNVADNGTINAYYGDASYTEDGSNGQVMVYQPKFYYKVTPMKLEANTTGLGYHLRKANYYVCDTPVDGFKLHPAFYDANGHEVDYILLSAYEGSMWDASESKYINDSVDTSIAYATGDLLCSVAGKKTISGLRTGMGTKANYESMANNRGSGWHLETIKATSLNQLLMVIELAMFNTQTGIGQGVVSITDNSSYNCSSLTGSTASLGNGTGSAASTVNEKGGVETTETAYDKVAVTYRGVENPWGNIWKHIQGVNIWGDGSMAGGQPFVCDDLSSFNESSHSGHYEGAGFTIPNADGYIKAMGYGNPDFDWLLMPSEIGGDSSLPVGDYCYVTANMNGYRVALLGSTWSYGANAGGFCWHCCNGVGVRHRQVGGRLLYVPTAR